MVSDTKENTSRIKSTAKENFTGKVATTTKDATIMMSEMAMEKCSSKMAPSTKVSGPEDSRMERAQ